jgi:pyruvate dehydrogenase E1 component alpha subunit
MHAESVDGQNVRAVYAAAKRLVERARCGDGPAFLMCNTYRYRGHHVGDINRTYYRSKEEEQRWMTERDPIAIHGAWLMEQNFADASLLKQIEAEVASELEAAVQSALAAPYPTLDQVEKDIYA